MRVEWLNLNVFLIYYLLSGDWGMGQLVNQQLVNVNTKKQLNNQTTGDSKFKKKKKNVNTTKIFLIELQRPIVVKGELNC